MAARVFRLGVIVAISGLLCLPAAAGDWSHTPIKWRTLGRGLAFTQVDAMHDDEVVATMSVVKIDPASNAFRVFHHAPQAITSWQKETGALAVFNGSYYSPDGRPVGLIVSDGKLIGPQHNSQMRGMFVAEPKGMSPDLPRATIIDLVSDPLTNPGKLPWTQGVQSFPLLLDHKGRIRVLSTGKRAHRTVVAADRSGNILVFNTSNKYFALFDLAQFLKASRFDIDSALNLDGGTEAQMFIKTKDFEYFSPPSWETSIGNLIDEKQYRLPTVVGVFPRQE